MSATKYCDDPDNCTYSDCPTAFCDRNASTHSPAPHCSADTELMKARSIGDALAAALMGEYSRADALGQWAADLKLPDNQELVDKLKAEGIPVEKWERIHANVYSPNTDISDLPASQKGTNETKA